MNFSALPSARLASLRMAAKDFLAVESEMQRRAGSLPQHLAGAEPWPPLRHYPSGDVYDFSSHAQFYFHAHRQGERGHVHLFLRPRGMPKGITPLTLQADLDSPCHLVAIGFHNDGRPSELFTTNRWVTAEAWYNGDDVVRMLPSFRFTQPSSHGLGGRWLAAFLAMTAPLVETLIAERDRAIADWADHHFQVGQANIPPEALEDNTLEITSRRDFDLGSWLNGLGVVED